MELSILPKYRYSPPEPRLGDHDQGYLYWIYLSCVKREDVQEKSEQVAITGHIFDATEKVHACIGQHIDCSEEVMHLLHSVLSDTLDISQHILVDFWPSIKIMS